MAGSSFSGIAVKLGVPVALVLAGLWAVDRYINSEAAKKIGSILLIFVFVLVVVSLLFWILLGSLTGLLAAAAAGPARTGR